MTRWILTLIGVALSSGCTLIPKYDRPQAPVPDQFPGASTAQEGRSASDVSWRELIAERRLLRLIELALAENRDLRRAALNVEQARAQYRITRANAYPTLEASAGLLRQHTETTVESWSVEADISAYELDFFGRIRSLNEQALQQYLATTEAQRAAQVSLVAEVAIQYFALREAEEQLSLARHTLETVLELYRLNQASFDAGAIGELDLRAAEGQVQTARVNVLTYERQLRQAENALSLLIGTALPADLPASASFNDPMLLAQVPAGLLSDLLARRPDILEAEHTLQAANANVGAARAAFFPSISLTGSVGRTSPELSDLFGSSTHAWSFQPQLRLPIFTGGANSANLEAAKVETRIEVASYEKAIQTAFREVADALIAESTYADEIQAQTLAIAAQQRRLELADARYRQGEDSYLNVLTAQQDLYAAQQGQLQAQFNRLSSQISLYRALGGGWQ